MNEEITQQPIENSQPTQESVKDFSYNDPQSNMKDLRRQIQEANERADQARRYAYEVEQKYKQNQTTEDFEIHGEDDALTEVKQLKKIDKKHAKSNEDMRNEIKNLKEYIDEQFVRNKYPDIEELTNDENVKKFSRQNPALYRSIMANPSLRDRGEVLAEQIKGMLKGENKYQEEDRRVAELKSKPKSVSSVAPAASISPIAAYDPNVRIILSTDEKKEVMRQAAEMKKRQTRTS